LDTLSGGERQTVLVAAALAQESRILLLDEPTAFLDPRHVSDIRRILRRVNRDRGTTVVMVTHDINGAALTSDRIAILAEGRIAFAGSPREVMCEDVLSPVYGKTFLFVNHPETGLPLVVPEEVRS
jgi:ABC-type cobalamin/Fe3+-siderophores transport system ATPase subunit